MARQTYRANLRASDFPLLSESYGHSVVIPGPDMHYVRPNAFSGSKADSNIGIPQIIFCENVMPISDGYQSVDFISPISAGVASDFDQAFYLRDSSENRKLFVPAAGKNYIYEPSLNTWTSTPIVAPADAIVSVVTLKGRTFVCYSNYASLLEWSGLALAPVVVTALTMANIRGITTANSYLVAWDYDTIYWSSSVDVVDFVPSLSSGAGSEKVLGLQGRIVYCKAVEDGFVIHTTTHAVYARYSGNIRFPWVFAELKGSGGIGYPDDASDAPHGTKSYVYTNNGLMVYDRSKAETFMPTLNEFLACGKYETYNHTTKTLDLTTYTERLRTKLAFIASRWLVVSYGTSTNMTHALVYDVAYQRWGKITLDHVDCFEFFGNPGTALVTSLAWVDVDGAWNAQVNPWSAWGTIQSGGLSSSTTPYRTLAFLCKDGQVKVVDFNYNNEAAQSVLFLGKFQFVRSNLCTLLNVEAEGLKIRHGPSKMAVLTSYDGSNIDKVTYPIKISERGILTTWQMRITGVNHVLRYEGVFQLTSVQLKTMLSGSR